LLKGEPQAVLAFFIAHFPMYTSKIQFLS